MRDSYCGSTRLHISVPEIAGPQRGKEHLSARRGADAVRAGPFERLEDISAELFALAGGGNGLERERKTSRPQSPAARQVHVVSDFLRTMGRR